MDKNRVAPAAGRDLPKVEPLEDAELESVSGGTLGTTRTAPPPPPPPSSDPTRQLWDLDGNKAV